MSKASRGRGRGRGANMSINIETIGFGRGEQLPAPTLQPPPKYPPLRKQPIPLLAGDEANYLLALKKEFIQTMQCSPYYIKAEVEKTDVERYTDKYRADNSSRTIAWQPDWRRLPKELKLTVRKNKRASKVVPPNVTKNKNRKKDDSEIKQKLEALEKKDVESEDKISEKEEEESEAEEAEVLEQDEEEEEENDYLTSYFDNGESYLDDEDDNLEDKEGGIY